MGQQLVNRDTSPLTLTAAGEEFLRMCEQVLDQVRVTRARIEEIGTGGGRAITLAAPQSLLLHFVPHWLEEHQLTSSLSPYLRATNWLAEDYFQALDRGECDLALCYWPRRAIPLGIDLAAYPFIIVDEDSLVPISAVDEAGRPRYRLPGSAAAPLPFIALHSRSIMAATLDAHLAAMPERSHLKAVNETSHAVNVKELVTQGYGVGWLPSRVARAGLDDGTLALAGDESWTVPLHLRLYRAEIPRHSQLTTLWPWLLERINDKLRISA